MRLYCYPGSEKGSGWDSVTLGSRDPRCRCSWWAQGGFGRVPELGEGREGVSSSALPHLGRAALETPGKSGRALAFSDCQALLGTGAVICGAEGPLSRLPGGARRRLSLGTGTTPAWTRSLPGSYPGQSGARRGRGSGGLQKSFKAGGGHSQRVTVDGARGTGARCCLLFPQGPII